MVYYDIVDFKIQAEDQKFAEGLGFRLIHKDLFLKLKVVQGKDELYNRLAIEKSVDVLLNPHLYEPKDHLHFRRGGLNQVSCKLACQKGVVICFSLDSLNNPIFIGRVMHDVRLCKKYNVKIGIVSFAKTKYDLRSLNDLLSFCKIIGLDGRQAKEAFLVIHSILERKGFKC